MNGLHCMYVRCYVHVLYMCRYMYMWQDLRKVIFSVYVCICIYSRSQKSFQILLVGQSVSPFCFIFNKLSGYRCIYAPFTTAVFIFHFFAPLSFFISAFFASIVCFMASRGLLSSDPEYLLEVMNNLPVESDSDSDVEGYLHPTISVTMCLVIILHWWVREPDELCSSISWTGGPRWARLSGNGVTTLAKEPLPLSHARKEF